MFKNKAIFLTPLIIISGLVQANSTKEVQESVSTVSNSDLIVAIQKGSKQMVIDYLNAGADINVHVGFQGYTPLMLAIAALVNEKIRENRLNTIMVAGFTIGLGSTAGYYLANTPSGKLAKFLMFGGIGTGLATLINKLLTENLKERFDIVSLLIEDEDIDVTAQNNDGYPALQLVQNYLLIYHADSTLVNYLLDIEDLIQSKIAGVSA